MSDKETAPWIKKVAAEILVGKDRCPICCWPLAKSAENGCVIGNCSYRPGDDREEELRNLRERRVRWKEVCQLIAAECTAPAPQPDWKKEALALVVLLRAKCSDEEWASMESRFAAATPQVTPELELEREADGRWIAELLGVAAYGPTREEAIWNAAKVLIEAGEVERG